MKAVLFLLYASGSLQGLFGRVYLPLVSPLFAILQKNTTENNRERNMRFLKVGQHRINAKNRIIQWVPNKNCE